MNSKQQIVDEINNQILSLMMSKRIDVSIDRKKVDIDKIKILSELEVLEEGCLIISKK